MLYTKTMLYPWTRLARTLVAAAAVPNHPLQAVALTEIASATGPLVVNSQRIVPTIMAVAYTPQFASALVSTLYVCDRRDLDELMLLVLTIVAIYLA